MDVPNDGYALACICCLPEEAVRIRLLQATEFFVTKLHNHNSASIRGFVLDQALRARLRECWHAYKGKPH
jgi:hypothetical protein